MSYLERLKVLAGKKVNLKAVDPSFKTATRATSLRRRKQNSSRRGSGNFRTYFTPSGVFLF